MTGQDPKKSWFLNQLLSEESNVVVTGLVGRLQSLENNFYQRFNF